MTADIWTMMWKEWREYLAGAGGRGRGAFVTLAIAAVASLGPPLQSGAAWMSSALPIVLCGCVLPWLFVLGVVTDSFAGERERHTLETLLASRMSDHAILFGKVAAATSYAWAIAVVTALTSLLVANLRALPAAPQLYPPATVAAILVLGLLIGLLAASGGCLASLRAATARQAQQLLSAGFFVLLLAGLLVVPLLGPGVWPALFAWADHSAGVVLPVAALLLLILDLLLLAGARAIFQRSRLIAS